MKDTGERLEQNISIYDDVFCLRWHTEFFRVTGTLIQVQKGNYFYVSGQRHSLEKEAIDE